MKDPRTMPHASFPEGDRVARQERQTVRLSPRSRAARKSRHRNRAAFCYLKMAWRCCRPSIGWAVRQDPYGRRDVPVEGMRLARG